MTYRDASFGDLTDDFDDPLALLGGEAGEFAGRTIGVKPVDDLFDEPVNVASQLRFVDSALRIERYHVRCKNASKWFFLHICNKVKSARYFI